MARASFIQGLAAAYEALGSIRVQEDGVVRQVVVPAKPLLAGEEPRPINDKGQVSRVVVRTENIVHETHLSQAT